MPIAIPRIGGSPRRGITGTSTKRTAIVATLNIAGDSAGMKNRRSEFSIPIIATDAATVVRNGSITLVSVVVNSSLPGVAANRGAIRLVIGQAKMIPRMTRLPVMTSSALITRLPRRHAASRPSRASVRVNAGTKAAVIAPSANRSRSRFGIRKATLNASISTPLPAPNSAARTASRATPSTRLVIVATPMSPAERASRELIRAECRDCRWDENL